MKLLHSFVNKQQTAWIWGFLMGRNGRTLTADPQSPTGFIAHAYEIQRSAPALPPLPPGTRVQWGDPNYHTWSHRRNFVPWRGPTTREAAITPVCGRLSTRSSAPMFIDVPPYQMRYQNITCPNCSTILERRNIQITTLSDLVRNDPYSSMGYEGRVYEPDPVSGQ